MESCLFDFWLRFEPFEEQIKDGLAVPKQTFHVLVTQRTAETCTKKSVLAFRIFQEGRQCFP